MRQHAASTGQHPPRSSADTPSLASALWGTWLFTSIAIAGLKYYPDPWGRATLGLIAAGFLVFAVARVAHSGSGLGRATYCAGYALMGAGNVIATCLALAESA